MNDLQHFIIFRRTSGHCANWLVRTSSLRDAMEKYLLHERSEAKLRKDGSIKVYDGYGGKIRYPHLLACIESEMKIPDRGEDWHGWEVRRLQQAHWDADFAEVFCSENPSDLKHHIELCRPLLRKRHPRSRAKAFVWYLNDGPLVTFYRPARRKRLRPIEVLGRYHLPWQTWPQAFEWHGSYDDILAQMAIEYPLP